MNGPFTLMRTTADTAPRGLSRLTSAAARCARMIPGRSSQCLATRAASASSSGWITSLTALLAGLTVTSQRSVTLP